MSSDGKARLDDPARQRAIRISAWIFVAAVIACYAWRVARVGLDLRQDFWVYSAPNRFVEDMNSALQKGNTVLREADDVAEEDHQKMSPRQRAEEARQIAAGHPPATIAHPGPGLFDSPVNPRIFLQRWNRLRPLYSQIIRGWVRTYESLEDQPRIGDRDFLDYPPLRLMVMTFWTWNVQTYYSGIDSYPSNPQTVTDPQTNRTVVATMDIVQPMLRFNATCEGVSAISIFILVWLWMERRPPAKSPITRGLFWPRKFPADLTEDSSAWARWGDPLLLVPVILLGLCTIFRSNITWQMPLPDVGDLSLIDERISSLGWWVFLLLRFLSAVCLARLLPRPYRAPMCGLVAATMAWMNPAAIMDSFGWPQWDSWLPPFFLVAAILVTLDCWIAAGFLLGIGCMFKGQLLFVSPVLVLCPLLAGWPGRFLRIISGLAVGAGLVVWPWLVPTVRSENWIIFAVTMAAFFCAASSLRKILRRQLVELSKFTLAWWRRNTGHLPILNQDNSLWIAAGIIAAAITFTLILLVHHRPPSLAVLLGISIVLAPWFLPRRLIAGWLVFVLAMALWLVAFQLGGKWSWWDIGFMYGTQKHQVMQLGAESLSNLSSLLSRRYGWDLHDHVTTWYLPLIGRTDLDVQGFLAWIYGIGAILCAVGAAIHMRRKDPRFLIAIAAPWVLFTNLLTQMTARYTVLPAVISAALIGVSAEMSLLPFLQTMLATLMLGNQIMLINTSTSPLALSITQPTYPEIAWMPLLIAAIFLYNALAPSRRAPGQIEVL